MATSATYSFEIIEEWGDAQHITFVTFYIHRNSYPSGAIHYFVNMHNNIANKEIAGGLAEKFIKSNVGTVEFTGSHSNHGDTAYRYDMDSYGYLRVRAMYPCTDKSKEMIFSGHYTAFIKEYGNVEKWGSF